MDLQNKFFENKIHILYYGLIKSSFRQGNKNVKVSDDTLLYKVKSGTLTIRLGNNSPSNMLSNHSQFKNYHQKCLQSRQQFLEEHLSNDMYIGEL